MVAVRVGDSMFESCQEIREFFSDYLDGDCTPVVARSIRFHLEYCDACGHELDLATTINQDLRALPRQPVPENLGLRLRVRVSQELNRNVLGRLLVRIDNLFGSRLLPGSLGLVGAIFCFCLIMGSEVVPANNFPDVPLAFVTQPQVLALAPLDFSTGDKPVIVMMDIDSGGQVVNYKVLSGQHSPDLMHHLDRLLYFSRFTPATTFGQPTQGAMVLSLRQITVRG